MWISDPRDSRPTNADGLSNRSSRIFSLPHSSDDDQIRCNTSPRLGSCSHERRVGMPDRTGRRRADSRHKSRLPSRMEEAGGG